MKPLYSSRVSGVLQQFGILVFSLIMRTGTLVNSAMFRQVLALPFSYSLFAEFINVPSWWRTLILIWSGRSHFVHNFTCEALRFAGVCSTLTTGWVHLNHLSFILLHLTATCVQMVVTTFNTSVPSASRYAQGRYLPNLSLDAIFWLWFNRRNSGWKEQICQYS